MGELQLVPRSASSRLLHDFSLDGGGNHYELPGLPSAATWPFFHLLKFTDERGGTGGPGLTRLFDFVDAVAVHRDTKVSDPSSFQWDSGAYAATLREPFNSMSQFRDPGLINLNTTTDLRVFNGMLGSLSFDPTVDNSSYWNVLQQSLRVPGFDLTTNSPSNPNHLNSSYPTQFLAAVQIGDERRI